MLLYHGTNLDFDKIDLSKSKDKRDYGRGFYTTTIYEQAKKWAENQFIRYGGKGAVIKTFKYTPNENLKVKIFSGMNEEWLEFVKECRTRGGLPHEFDLVQGPVANDNTMRTIALYISGIYTTAQAIEQLRFFKANDQISFHTERALGFLAFVRNEES